MGFLDKRYCVTMPDGSVWAVPVRVIAEDHAAYYYKKCEYQSMEMAMQHTIEYFEDDFEVMDWAKNNMNWVDVEKFAEQVSGPAPVDYQEGWNNGEVEIKDD